MNIRPPRIKYNDPNDFGPTIFRDSDRRAVESLGHTVIDNEYRSASGWLKFKDDVPEHKDGFGRCWVYCAGGKGVLREEGEEPRTLTPGSHIVFDDRNMHSFQVTAKPCYLLVVNIED